MNREQRVLSLSQVCPSVWVGPWFIANNKEILLKYKINHIVNASGLENSFPNDFTYLKIDIEDDPEEDISRYFTKTSRFIQNAVLKGGTVLIHCIAGLSRSPTLAVAYLVQKKKYKLTEALLKIAEVRPDVEINSGFLQQLKNRFN